MLTALRPQAGGLNLPSWYVIRAVQIRLHGLWCQVNSASNAGMGSNIGDWYFPSVDGTGFTQVPSNDSAPYQSLKCNNQIALVVDGDENNIRHGIVRCTTTVPNLDRTANHWAVYSNERVREFGKQKITNICIKISLFAVGPTVDSNMTLSVLSSRDADPNIEFSFTFMVSSGPPSQLQCKHGSNTIYDKGGNQRDLTREVIRSRYINSSLPDMTRVTVTMPPQPRVERTYECTVRVMSLKNGIISSGSVASYDTNGQGTSSITVTGNTC